MGELCSIPGHENPWKRAFKPLQYYCLENPHGQRSLAGYSPWDHKESETTERLSTQHLLKNFFSWNIVFFFNIVPIFSFYRFLNQVWGKVCAQLEITVYRIQRTKVWVLILSKLFLLPALEWVIHQFLCFWGRGSSTRIFSQASAPHPCFVQASTVINNTLCRTSLVVWSKTLYSQGSGGPGFDSWLGN